VNRPKATLKLPIRFSIFLLGERSVFTCGLRLSSQVASGLEAVKRRAEVLHKAERLPWVEALGFTGAFSY